MLHRPLRLEFLNILGLAYVSVSATTDEELIRDTVLHAERAYEKIAEHDLHLFSEMVTERLGHGKKKLMRASRIPHRLHRSQQATAAVGATVRPNHKVSIRHSMMPSFVHFAQSSKSKAAVARARKGVKPWLLLYCVHECGAAGICALALRNGEVPPPSAARNHAANRCDLHDGLSELKTLPKTHPYSFAMW